MPRHSEKAYLRRCHRSLMVLTVPELWPAGKLNKMLPNEAPPGLRSINTAWLDWMIDINCQLN